MAAKLTLDAAQVVIAAARQEAEKIGQPVDIAIVDDGNNLVAFARMDGALLGSIDVAMNKAYTARAFEMPTDSLTSLAQPGQPLYGIEASNHGRIILFGGGVPLEDNGVVVGAVGVSGGSVPHDQEVARAGAAAFGSR
jgi:cob(I)alamin adenosyltransferase